MPDKSDTIDVSVTSPKDSGDVTVVAKLGGATITAVFPEDCDHDLGEDLVAMFPKVVEQGLEAFINHKEDDAQ